jgi:hypothetical protein
MSRAFQEEEEGSRGRQRGRDAEEANSDTSPRDRTLSLSLATLVTPTTSTPMHDNISLIPPLMFHLASTHLGRDTQQKIHWSVEGPRGSETPTSGLHNGTNQHDLYPMLWKAYPRKTRSTFFSPNLCFLLIGTFTLAKQPQVRK